jgi:hypothetical protein
MVDSRDSSDCVKSVSDVRFVLDMELSFMTALCACLNLVLENRSLVRQGANHCDMDIEVFRRLSGGVLQACVMMGESSGLAENADKREYRVVLSGKYEG